jgi:hypothetical protein
MNLLISCWVHTRLVCILLCIHCKLHKILAIEKKVIKWSSLYMWPVNIRWPRRARPFQLQQLKIASLQNVISKITRWKFRLPYQYYWKGCYDLIMIQVLSKILVTMYNKIIFAWRLWILSTVENLYYKLVYFEDDMYTAAGMQSIWPEAVILIYTDIHACLSSWTISIVNE